MSTDEVRSTYAQKEWLEGLLPLLDSNEGLPHADMGWKMPDGKIVADWRGVYLRQGGLLGMICDCCSAPLPADSGSLLHIVEVTGNLTDPQLLRMVRMYVHTGLVVYKRTEGPLQLLKRYECCDFFGLTTARKLLESVIIERLDIQAALKTFDAISLKDYSDPNLSVEIESFVKRHIGEIGRSALAQLSAAAFPRLCQLLMGDDVNVSEVKLMESLFSLCEKKTKTVQAATEMFFKEQACLGDQRVSMWACVRVQGLTHDSLLQFRTAHPGALDDTFYMTLMNFNWSNHMEDADKRVLRIHNSSSLQPPRMQTLLSCYPRNLKMPDTTQSSSFVVTSFEEDNVIVSYAGVHFSEHDQVPLPPFRSSDCVVQMRVWFQGQWLLVTGGIDMKCSSLAPEVLQHVQVTVSVVNFRHARWNKGSVTVNRGDDFEIPRIISLNTLKNDGYRFDPAVYPDYKSGRCILLKIVISFGQNDVKARSCSEDMTL